MISTFLRVALLTLPAIAALTVAPRASDSGVVDSTPIAAAASSGAEQGDDTKVVRALEEWVRNYLRGKLDLVDLKRFRGVPRSAKDYVSIKYGLVPESRVEEKRGEEFENRFNHEKELIFLCEEAAKLNSADAAEALLMVAAVGLDGKKRDAEELPGLVRGIGDRALANIRTTAAQQKIRAVAAEMKGAESRAALHAVGWFKDEADHPLLQQAMQHKDEWIRQSAAVAAGRTGHGTLLPLLADQAEREEVETVVAACIDAMTSIVRGLEPAKRDDRALRRATTSVIRCLGKFAWQVDQSAVSFLKLIRSKDSVPALIGVLERAQDDSRKKPKRNLQTSGVFLDDAHELLVKLSGANFPLDTPHQWREWWNTVHDDFELAEDTGEARLKPGDDRTTTGTFFGIPVRGNHVLFIVDLSGSMAFASFEQAANGQSAQKMEIARRELRGAVERMAADSRFNLVWFNKDVGAWKPKLVEATEGNKRKFFDYMDRAEPNGGTNVWGGLREGLSMKVVQEADRYESDVDEIFVLSDGAPSVGEIIDPKQILDAVRDANSTRRVRINTVFIEGPEDKKAATGNGNRPAPFKMEAHELMRRLAEEHGGVAIRPGQPEGSK